MDRKENASQKFQIIVQHKNKGTNNLNQLFSAVGCDTLAARVPVVQNAVVNDLQQASGEQRRLMILEQKSTAASKDLMGIKPKTKDRQLSLAQVGRQVFIAAGPERGKEDVDENELNQDIEQYMKVTAQMVAEKGKKRQQLGSNFLLPNLGDNDDTMSVG